MSQTTTRRQHKTTRQKNDLTLMTKEKKPVETEDLDGLRTEFMTEGIAIISYGRYTVEIRPDEEDRDYEAEELRKSLLETRPDQAEYGIGRVEMTREDGDTFTVIVEDMEV